MRETQASIATWARATFGPPASCELLVKRTVMEMDELVHAVAASRTSRERIMKEAADVLVVLYQVAAYCDHDLLDEVDRVMAVNRTRKWRLNADGTGQHVD